MSESQKAKGSLLPTRRTPAFELTSEALATPAGCECKAAVSLVDVTRLPDGLVHPASRDAHEKHRFSVSSLSPAVAGRAACDALPGPKLSF